MFENKTDYYIVSGRGVNEFNRFKKLDDFSEREKELIATSVLADTEYLTSSRFTNEDKKLYEELNTKLDVNGLKNKYLKTTDFSKGIDENLHEDYKEYTINGKKINRSIIKSNTSDRKKYYDEYTKSMKSSIINLLIWCDYEMLETYFNYNGINLTYPTFTTSTNLILNYLEKKKYLRR